MTLLEKLTARSSSGGETKPVDRVASALLPYPLRHRRDLLGQAQEGAAGHGAGDAGVGFEELGGAGGAQLFEGVDDALQAEPRRPEQGRDRDAENFGDMLQAAGTDAVRAVFVLLDLLESDADLAGEFCLRHALREAQRTDAQSHGAVVGIGMASLAHSAYLPQSVADPPNLRM
jgi:hypothetical protein